MGRCKICGVTTQGTFTLCYDHAEKQKKKDFVNYGRRHCKKCGRAIPGNRTYCWSCYPKK